MKSKLGTLDFKDLIKIFITTFGTSIIASLIMLFNAGKIEWTWQFWQVPVYAAVAAALTEISRRLGTNSQDELGTKEPT